jgi:endonuclease YncB( thermonuclease family)
VTRRAPTVLLSTVALALVALTCSANAQTATIVDGDKIDIDATRYRLFGVAAPDARQICDDGYPAGAEAILALRRLMTGRRIDCESRGRDPSGRVLALCRANGRDLGEALVRAGMAWADPRTGRNYIEVERDARTDRLRVHDHA